MESKSLAETNYIKLRHKCWNGMSNESFSSDNLSRYDNYDLCPACMKKLADFLDGSVTDDEDGTAQG